MRPRFELIVLGLLLILAGCAQAIKPRPEAAFPYAFATNTCAPWDGSATRIVLQRHPIQPGAKNPNGPVESYPSLTIRVWISNPGLNQWISLSNNQGGASACTGPNQCTSKQGRIRFSTFTEKQIEGEFREPLEDGTNRELAYPFKAPVYSIRMFCG